ncbi:MAG TPA: hypothetical protein VJT09_06280 [Pyrinomonadaceae bacterium]|nr:hypothetical protein [Pyrinomonadaceae bacterium]
MKLASRITLLVTLILSSVAITLGQDSSVDALRSQLSDVQKREEELRGRVSQLDEDLRPENIEKYFALNGSTHPEELRAERRRQLENEKARVQAQLDQLAQSRVRLETAIATAEAAAYRQSAPQDSYTASPGATNTSQPAAVKPRQSQRRAGRKSSRRARRRG